MQLNIILISAKISDYYITIIIGIYTYKFERNKIVEEKFLNQYNYKISIGEKIYSGLLEENGVAIIENVNLKKNDFEHVNPQLSIFLNDNNIYPLEEVQMTIGEAIALITISDSKNF